MTEMIVVSIVSPTLGILSEAFSMRSATLGALVMHSRGFKKKLGSPKFRCVCVGARLSLVELPSLF